MQNLRQSYNRDPANQAHFRLNCILVISFFI